MPHSLQNIHNLTDLWLNYGAQKSMSNEHFDFYCSQQWPHRHWFDTNSSIESVAENKIAELFQQALEQSKAGAILPIWQIPNVSHSQYAKQQLIKTLQNNGWQDAFQQKAMYIAAHQLAADTSRQSTLSLTKVTTAEDVAIWSDIGSRAFNYVIDVNVINHIVNQHNCHLYLAWQGKTVVAGGMLFKTGKVVGLHQMSVDPNFQGQGIAKMFMYNLLDCALELGATTVTLQASPAGYPLYQKLGFIDLFDIVSYKKIADV